MRNNDFQDMVKKGDTLVIQPGNVRDTPGKRYKFVGFTYCKHTSNSPCKGCTGQIKYEDLEYKRIINRGCLREYNDGNTQDYLIIKVDILPGLESWVDNMEWEL